MSAPRNETGVGCVILGAGAGSRFGEPKAGALLPDGRRFIDAIAASVRDAGADFIVSVLPPNIDAPPGTHRIVNSNARAEQITSVRLGLAQMTNRPLIGTLIWPVDHPFVSVETARTLISRASTERPLILRPTHNGEHGHPVYFSRDIWRDLVTVQHGGAREIVHQYASEVQEIEVADAGVLRDIDTKSDMAGG
jgi:molybdenum cofactor cytidylyltransferase